MSYSVIRIAKFTAGSVKGIEIHNKREKEGVSHSNPDIDWSRSKDNVSLGEADKTYRKAIKDRLAEAYTGKRAVRKDAIVMCEAIITSDKEFFDRVGKDATIDYFDKSLEFLKDKYGQDNIIDATLHLDEATPHIHVDFVPLTSDGRLSAKELIGGKTSLVSLHTEFNKAVGKQFGLERGEVGTGVKHMDTPKFKVQKAKEQLESLNKSIEQAKTTCAEINAIDSIKPERTITGAIKGITIGQINELKEQAKNSVALESQLSHEKFWSERYEEKASNFNELDVVTRVADLEKNNKQLKESCEYMHEKIKSLQSENNGLKNSFETIKDGLRQVKNYLRDNAPDVHEKLVKLKLLNTDLKDRKKQHQKEFER